MDENTYREILPWVILNRAPGLSPGLAQKLINKFTSPADVISQREQDLIYIGLSERTARYLHNPDNNQIESDLQWMDQDNHYFIHYHHPQYPELLRHIADPPLAIYMAGNINEIYRPQLAIIGSRKATPGGKKIAYEFARQLGECGIVITSGLASGIDSAAHKGALSSGNSTIAVMGNGLDTVYPKVNRELAEQIIDSGLLISEFPIKTRPLAYHFPRRNRIISGLSLGVLVVEASMKSGSLITAKLAADQGREVFVIPGSILNPVAEGCNNLISNGAKLTVNIEDIIEEIPVLNRPLIQCKQVTTTSQLKYEVLDEQLKLLLDNIGYEPASFDEMVINTGLSADKLRVLLTEMELEKLIQITPGGRYVRT